MTQPYLNQLFDAHIQDLADAVREHSRDLFCCPICLRPFDRTAIAQNSLDQGHVWPEDFRKEFKGAEPMSVLLCKRCNNRAGTRGDAQVQLGRNIRKGGVSGELFGVQRFQLFRKGETEPIELRTTVVRRIEDGVETWIHTGRTDEQGKWSDSSPRDQERFGEIVGTGERVDGILLPPRGYRPELEPAGLITSAYLMAFYRLGYHYIGQLGMDDVRRYILDTFEDETLPSDWPRNPNFTIRQYDRAYFPSPELRLVFPLDDSPIYVLVSCFQYQIRLPLRVVGLEMTEILGRITSAPLIPPNTEFLSFTITCTKTVPHDCLYDYILGKPRPNV